jgi:hypothetical protein
VNNYGANMTISQPDSLQLGRLLIGYSGYHAGDFRLFQRATGDFGNTWGAELDSAARFLYAPNNSSLTWTANNHVTSFNSQFVIVNNDITPHNNQVVNQQKSRWVISDIYPNPGRGYFRINIEAPDNTGRDVRLMLMDAKGAVVQSVTERLSRVDNTLLISLPELAAGIYMLHVVIAGEVAEVRKLTIE